MSHCTHAVGDPGKYVSYALQIPICISICNDLA